MSAFSKKTEPALRTEASASVILRHAAGLHARPAIKLAKLAKKFRSKICIANSPGGPWVDAKSIVKIIAMKTPRDAALRFRAEGDDAEAAVQALVALVERDFPDDG